MSDNVLTPQTQPRARTLPRIQLREVPSVNRGACASVGFFAGWLPLTCCSLGILPAVLAGFGLATGYFALDKTILWGFGMMPILVLVSAAIILGSSYLVARPVFATHSRDVAVRHFKRTAGFMALAAGVTYIAWMELVMPLLFLFGVPMGALFGRR